MKSTMMVPFLSRRALLVSRLVSSGRRCTPGAAAYGGGGSRVACSSAPHPPRRVKPSVPLHSLDAARRFASSVSSQEVDKFSALDDDWWDPRKNPLIHMNAVRMQYIRTMVDQQYLPERSKLMGDRNAALPFQGLRVLDIGCGGGLASESLARLGAAVTGLDPSPRLVRAARAHSQLDERTRSIDYIGGRTAEDLARERAAGAVEAFDIVCLLEVIEHATDVPSLLRATSELLKPDGLLFLSTINRTMKSYFLTIVGAEYVMRYIPIGTHDWSKYMSPEDVKSLADKIQLQPLDVAGMVLGGPPLLGSWDWKLSRQDFDVNWIGTYVKISDERV